MSQSILDINRFKRAYFIGIGGIGMSALARYFKSIGWEVAGYDKTPSNLTDRLQEEGVAIHFEDFGPSIPMVFRDPKETLVIYTPAIPVNLGELLFVKHEGFTVKKRAEVLGMITRSSKGLAVAGTHGKTTTSSLLAHILNESDEKCNAFLGGISSNFNSNFVSGDSPWTVVEADEFDRSFLQLHPFASIVTSTDADHLDIYGDENEFLNGFKAYVKQIDSQGVLIRHASVKLNRPNCLSYGLNVDADYRGENIRVENGFFQMDVRTPNDFWEGVELGLPGVHNADNAIACLALCEFIGLSKEIILHGLKTFKGVKRRFEYHLRTPELVYIDDYAHHPTEIKALIDSIKILYAGQRVTGIFQPHLFSRTRDFFAEFAAQLSRLDEVILLPIYPAREEPISGITSDALLKEIQCDHKAVMHPEEVVKKVGAYDEGVVLTIGAGDIDRIVLPLKSELSK